MGELPSPEPDIYRAMELADGYLSDAEHVLWRAAAETDNPELTTRIENLTQEMWTIQQELQDIQESRNQ